MFNSLSRLIQRTVCLLAATFIVGGSLALGAVGVQSAQCLDYQVTITQLA